VSRSTREQPSKSIWLIAGLFALLGALLAALVLFEDQVMPAMVTPVDATPGKREPVVEQVDAPGSLQRDVARRAGDIGRDEPGAREFAIHVAERQRAGELPLRVELLFGARDSIKAVTLIVDRNGDAIWPGGGNAPRPRYAQFAFPTVSPTTQTLSPEQSDAYLTMPEVCVLEIDVLEVDGRPSSDMLTAEVRSAAAAWPQNRWRPLRLQGGSQKLLAEARGERIEVRVSTASGRSAQAVFFASETPDERVPCAVHLPPSNGVDVELIGLPRESADASWHVRLHDLTHEPLTGHLWPGTEHRYVLFPRSVERQAIDSWLVLARSQGAGAGLHWGQVAGAGGSWRAGMQPAKLVARGRVVDGAGAGLPGFHVDLVARPSGVVLNGVISDQDGGYQLMGPDPSQVAMEVVLRERRENQPPAIPLPVDGNIVLQVAR